MLLHRLFPLFLVISFTNGFFFDSIFGTSAPRPSTTSDRNPNTGPVVLDYFAHKLCPKHLPRNRYLMYYSYVKRCYAFVISNHADWFSAKDDCSFKGGNLMHIHQSLESYFLGLRGQIALEHKDSYIWIGLSDTTSPGSFTWTNGPLKGYKDWYLGQPAVGTPGDNCVAYRHDTNDWWVFPCNTTKLGWVCEFELNATMATMTTELVPSSTVNIQSSTITTPTSDHKTSTRMRPHFTPSSSSAPTTNLCCIINACDYVAVGAACG